MRNFNFFASPFFGNPESMFSFPHFHAHKPGLVPHGHGCSAPAHGPMPHGYGCGCVPPMPGQHPFRFRTIPAVNIAESDDGFVIEMAAPGYAKEDFKVSVEKDVLSISVEKCFGHGCRCHSPESEAAGAGEPSAGDQASSAEKSAPKDKKVYRREFRYASFSRAFALPEGVDAGKIEGAYENGILTLSIPKLEAGSSKIQVAIK